MRRDLPIAEDLERLTLEGEADDKTSIANPTGEAVENTSIAAPAGETVEQASIAVPAGEVVEQTSIANPPTEPTKKSKRLEFFARFPGFWQLTSRPISEEFGRLARFRGWKKGKKYKKSWNQCMSQQFDLLIGNRENDFETWKKMCEKLNIPGEFNSINKCKEALKKVHVNIVDLINCWDSDESPRTFETKKQLANYTKRTGFTFPRSIAKKDKIVSILLRHVIKGSTEAPAPAACALPRIEYTVGRGHGRGGRGRGRGRGRGGRGHGCGYVNGGVENVL